jgi:hypothetical protein
VDLVLLQEQALDGVRGALRAFVKTFLTLVGNSAGSTEPTLRTSPPIGHGAKILSAKDLSLSYDAERFPYT